MDFNRESFVFYKDWYNAISQLDNVLRLELYDAIMKKVFYNEPPSLSTMGSLAMSFIEPQIERDFEKWSDIREKRSNAGKKHHGNQYSLLEQMGQMEQDGTNGTSVPTLEQNGTNGTNDAVNVNDNIDSRKKTLLDMSVVSEQMLPVVELWLKYKRERKESYKPIGFNTFYKRLCKLSNSNADVAMQIIENSMQNNYAGIFPLKDIGHNSNAYPRTVDDVRNEDIPANIDHLKYVMFEKRFPRLYNGISKGLPNTKEEFDRMTCVTRGGLRGVAYVLLVLDRDGWERYDDERGFMWIYFNFIKANGLFNEG